MAGAIQVGAPPQALTDGCPLVLIVEYVVRYKSAKNWMARTPWGSHNYCVNSTYGLYNPKGSLL